MNRDERGSSLTVFTATAMMAVFLTAGLVVDGTARVRAHREAEVAAASALRKGTDATAAQRLIGRDGTAEGLAAARRALTDADVQGDVTAQAGVMTVTTRSAAGTTFLSLIGVRELPVTGSASGELRRV
ncbi:pilus assembly protein TadE [Luteococcus sp. Sow4_B9]|uniref:pilus assembly protein TadE n=1 Tax=Luteococcus sp. Sow4_B9 TaxID=3438792 RepID=UPI003F9E898D